MYDPPRATLFGQRVGRGEKDLFGVLDFALKKYVPQGGTAFIYALTILLLLWRPQGLFGVKAT